MSHTVISVFDEFADADNARDMLIGSGFPIADVQLTPSEDTLTSRQSTLVRTGHHVYDVDSGWSLSSLLSSLFGADKTSVHPDLYSEAIRRGSYLLTVEAETDPERDRAVDILNRFNPVDIDERASQWRQGGWSAYDREAPILSAEEMARERGSYQPAAATGVKPERRGVRSFRRAEAAGADTTGLPPEGTNEAIYRSHWDLIYGEPDRRFEDDAAAYAYGEKLSYSETYRGYRWGDVEPEARLEWESNDAGSPWERAKDAVRYAWERMTR